MRHVLGWKAFEAHVNAILGLDATVASGSQFYDKGDGVDRGQGDWAFQTDAKYTEAGSFTVNRKLMGQYVTRAQMAGKRFVLAVRLVRNEQVADYAVVPLDDFAEMLTIVRSARG